MNEANPSVASGRQNSSQQPASIDKAELRRQIDELVMGRGVEMVRETINQVKEGHYQALKYLFEMIGLYPAPIVAEKADHSVAVDLLTHLGLKPPENADTQSA